MQQNMIYQILHILNTYVLVLYHNSVEPLPNIALLNFNLFGSEVSFQIVFLNSYPNWR